MRIARSMEKETMSNLYGWLWFFGLPLGLAIFGLVLWLSGKLH